MNEMTTEQRDYELATERIKLAECLSNLYLNKDFQELIINNYLDKYTKRLVMLKAIPNMQDSQNQKAIESSLCAISEFNQFLLYVTQEGNLAKKTIEDYNSFREEEIN